METIIEIDHLHKSYGKVAAVQDLSFRVREGELFAFLGVNGAGKSTTIHILCGQLPKDSGRVFICGRTWKPAWMKSSAVWGWCFRARCWIRSFPSGTI